MAIENNVVVEMTEAEAKAEAKRIKTEETLKARAEAKAEQDRIAEAAKESEAKAEAALKELSEASPGQVIAEAEAEAKKTEALAGKTTRSDEQKAGRENGMRLAMPHFVFTEDKETNLVTLMMTEPLTLRVHAVTGNSGNTRYHCTMPDKTSFDDSFNNTMVTDRVESIRYAYRSVMYRVANAVLGDKPVPVSTVKAENAALTNENKELRAELTAKALSDAEANVLGCAYGRKRKGEPITCTKAEVMLVLSNDAAYLDDFAEAEPFSTWLREIAEAEAEAEAALDDNESEGESEAEA